MRIKVIQKPSVTCIDGIRVDQFTPGQQYEVGNVLGAVFLCEGWAEPVDDPEPALVIPLRELDPDMLPAAPANLIRDTCPPYFDGPPAQALDRRRRPRNRRAS